MKESEREREREREKKNTPEMGEGLVGRAPIRSGTSSRLRLKTLVCFFHGTEIDWCTRAFFLTGVGKRMHTPPVSCIL